MKKHIRLALAAIAVTLAATGCKGSRQEVERKAQEAEQKAEAELTAAKIKAEKEESAKVKAERADERAKLQKDLDAHERKASYLRQKAAKTVGATKRNADAALNELDARRVTAKASMSRLSDETTANWDATKKSAEDDIAAVGRAVDSLEHTLAKK